MYKDDTNQQSKLSTVVYFLTWCVKFPHLWADLNEEKHLTRSRTKHNLVHKERSFTSSHRILCSVYMCVWGVYVCVCVSVWVGCVCVCVCMWVSMWVGCVCVCVCVSLCVCHILPTYPGIVDNGATLHLLSLRPQSRHLSPDRNKL